MLIVIANDLPSAVRGRMKIWFVEARPNVFVSGINESTALRVIDYLYEHCPPSSGITIFRKIRTAPGYEIRTIGETKKAMTQISGLQLIIEKELNNS